MTAEEKASIAKAYYDAVASRPPTESLVEALRRFDDESALAGERFAVDLGCGEGRDTAELLRRGWRVLAIDAQAEGIRRLLARPNLTHPEWLTTQVARFEEETWPDADLVNASYSIPFCPAEHFP